jgi:hypothetical protein
MENAIPPGALFSIAGSIRDKNISLNTHRFTGMVVPEE